MIMHRNNSTLKLVMPLSPLLATAVMGTLASLYAFVIRPRHLRWGATDNEVKASSAADDLVPNPTGEATHAITINAPVSEVWPWLVQMGQDKAGFYSYSLLENLFGCQLQNAERILPEFQNLRAGDSVRLHPEVPPLPVLICEPNKALVLGSNLSHPGTWGFFLKPIDGKTTRLIVRGREQWRNNVLYSLYYRVLFEPAHFVMERRMLLGIKERAERLSSKTGTCRELPVPRTGTVFRSNRRRYTLRRTPRPRSQSRDSVMKD